MSDIGGVGRSGAPTPRAETPTTTAPKIDGSLFSSLKDMFAGVSMMGKMSETAKLGGNLGIDGARFGNAIGSVMSEDAQERAEARQEVMTAAYDGAKDIGTSGLLRKTPLLKTMFFFGDAASEGLKYNESRNQYLAAKGKVADMDHTQALIGQPYSSEQLEQRATLHRDMLGREVDMNRQLLSSVFETGKAAVSYSPAGDVATFASFTYKAMSDADWSKFPATMGRGGRPE